MVKIKKVLFILILPLFISACETLQVQQISTSQNFVPEQDESRLWKRQDDLEESLKNSGFIYPDGRLRQYVNQVLDKLTGNIEEFNKVDIRVYIISDPEFNAFSLSNGAIFIHTSILGMMDNEAQLATLLGHEASHFLYRHELKQFRNIKNKTALFSTLQATFAGAPYSSGSLINLLSGYAVLGSIYGYSQSMEREADENAIKLMMNAGYDPREAKKFLENLYEATKFEDTKMPYFYSTHPKTKERIKDYDKLLKDLEKQYDNKLGGIINTKEYLILTRNAFSESIALGIKANKIKAERFETERYIKFYPEDFIGYYYMGQINLLDNKNDEAESQFKESISIKQNFPGNHACLGMLYYKKGNKQLAKQEFNEYLRLNPDAQDAQYIRGYINE